MTVNRLAKNNEYLAQADVLLNLQMEESKNISDYQKEKENASSEPERQELEAKIRESNERWEQLEEEILRLERLNQALFVVEPELREKLYSIEKDLMSKYTDKTSERYVGENPVEIIRGDLLTRSIFIYVDPDRMEMDGNNVPRETSVDGIPVNIRYAKMMEDACNPNTWTGVCRPVLAGVSVAEKNTLAMGTAGYKATYGGQVGFVITGHQAKAMSNPIVQPHNDATKVVGQVQTICWTSYNACSGDFAWIRPDNGISVNDDIFINPLQTPWDINSKRAESGQTEGTFIRKAGASTGVTTGNITYKSSSHIIYANYYTEPGDSGSPVFRASGAVTAELFGLHFFYNTEYNEAVYWPQDYIQTKIGAVASTT